MAESTCTTVPHTQSQTDCHNGDSNNSSELQETNSAYDKVSQQQDSNGLHQDTKGTETETKVGAEFQQEKLQELTMQLKEKEQLLLEKEKHIRELEREKEVMVTKHEEELKQRDFEMNELRERQNAQIQHLEKQLRLLQTKLLSQTTTCPNNETKSDLLEYQTAPSELYYGSCTMDKHTDTAYFRDGHTDNILSYNRVTKSWSKLASCPNKDFALVVVDGLLTAVGGYNASEKDTNKLLSFTTEYKDTESSEETITSVKRWIKVFPPMPTKRYTPAAVCTEKHLIVAGGSIGDGEPVSKVEIMNFETQTWWLASSLPYHVTKACIAVSGDNVFVLGGLDTKKEWITSALSCSLYHMVHTAQSATLGTRLKRGFTRVKRQGLWQPIANLPSTRSSCVVINGQLLAIGGDAQGKYNSEMYVYKPSSDSWEIMGNITTPRARCLTVALTSNEVMVVGGYTTLSDFKGSNTFEIVELNK